MTLPVLGYALLLATLLGAAAHFLDRALRGLGRPTRWVWLAAMGGSLLGPVLPRFFPAAGAEPVTGGGGLPLELLYRLAAAERAAPGRFAVLIESLDRAVPLLWAGMTGLLALLLVLATLRLWRAGRRLSARTLRGEDVFVSLGLGPAVLGLLRPRIVLPSWILTLDEEAVEMVLLHEREHLRARDPVLLALGMAAVLAMPLNPALWWMLARLRLAVEGDCDGRVLALGTPRRPYVNLLMTVASRTRGSFSLAPALTEGGRSTLERRLQMMHWNVRKNRVRVAVGGIATSALLLVLACETPAPPSLTAPSEDQGVEARATFEAQETGPAGVVVRKADGAEAKILVREDGEVSFQAQEAGGDPLIIVDGVIVSDPDIVEKLSPETIERIEVIKGAAAKALYGERAANGVIQIKTKEG